MVNAGSDVTVTAGDTFSLSGSYTDTGATVSSSGIAWDSDYDGSTFVADTTGTLTPSLSYATPWNISGGAAGDRQRRQH